MKLNTEKVFPKFETKQAVGYPRFRSIECAFISPPLDFGVLILVNQIVIISLYYFFFHSLPVIDGVNSKSQRDLV